MGTTSDKLTYLNTTKGKIKDVINMTGANITSDTTFRNYATKLYDGYISVLKDKNTLLDNMPKGTSTSYITDAANLPVYEDKMSKESIQDGTPTPENPIEIKTVKGYRNLFDIEDGTYTDTGGTASASITFKDGVMTSLTHNFSQSFGIKIPLRTPITLKANTTYTRANYSNYIYPYIALYDINSKTVDTMGASDNGIRTYMPTKDIEIHYIYLWFTHSYNYSDLKPMMNEGTTIQSYVPYGTNYVAITNTNGTDTNYYTIPLNDNEIAGIGDYKDELIVDKNGHCWLNKKTGKVVLDGSENWQDRPNYTYADRFVLGSTIIPRLTVKSFSNYFLVDNIPGDSLYHLYLNNGQQIGINFSQKGTTTLSQFKEWLTTHNTDIYYPTLQENLIDLNYTVDIELFKGINNISNSDDMDMTITYVQDINMIIDNLINGQSL